MLNKKAMASLLMCLLVISVAAFIIGNGNVPQTKASSTDTNPVTPPEVNVCMHLDSFSNPATVVADMKMLGVRWVRIDWIPNNATMDSFMQTMHANNISVLAIIDSNTMGNQYFNMDTWNSTIKSILQDPNSSYTDAWEIWNEPNSPTCPYAWFSPQDYYHMVRNASSIIRNSTNASIVAAGLSPDGTWNISDLYKTYPDTGNYIDYQGVHVYADVNSNLANIASVQISKKPIWVTEYGAPSAPIDESNTYTEQGQAAWVQVNFAPLQAHALKIFWYELYDETIQPTVKENSFGLITLDETRKTAFYTFQTIDKVEIASALNYLSLNYNKGTVGLVHESPDSVELTNTYWLYSDNFLVQKAFEPYLLRNSTIASINQNISAIMSYWLNKSPNLLNQYQVLNNSAILPFYHRIFRQRNN